MTSIVRQPSSHSLRDVVTRMGYAMAGAGPDRVEAIMPTARTNLMFDLSGGRFSTYTSNVTTARTHAGAIAAGPATEPLCVRLEQRITVWADFTAAGAPAVLGVPASEIHDVIDLEVLWGPDAEWLRDRLAAVHCADAALAVLEAALLNRLRSELLSPAMSFAAASLEGGAQVREVAACLEVSPKRLGRIFRQSVGLAPKLYSRVRRVQRLLGHLAPPAKPNWAVLAVEHGYYDQAHLINDFRSVTGMTPAAYLDRVTDAPNHAAVGARTPVAYFSNTGSPASP